MKKIGDNIIIDQQNNITIIQISDNLGYDTADDLRTAYNDVETSHILVDLGQVTITTSRGMATLLSIIVEGQEEERSFYYWYRNDSVSIRYSYNFGGLSI